MNMDDLPTAASDASNNPINTNPSAPSGQAVSIGGISKEGEKIGLTSGEISIAEIGKPELELPKELSAIGISTQPTTVQVPQQVSQLGVKPAGDNVSLGTGSSVSLPLTDDQIAQGLKQGITSSWRWLAEWCRRRLKQFRLIK